MVKKKILVVDDEPTVLAMLEDMIGLYIDNVEMTSASNGQLALEEFNKVDFNLVISDVLMPVMNGLEFLIEVKKIKPKTPVIIMSGDTAGIKYEKLLQAGACAFIKKPLEIMEIVALIKEVL